ncbi:MAG: beta-propeller fold lactonase family protein [Armatimonadota bacterium]
MHLPRPLTAALAAGVLLAAPLASLLPADAGESLALPPLPRATRGPVQIAFTPDGKRALVTESDEGTLAVFDAQSGAFQRRLPTGGKQPEAMAVTPDGLALVANALSGSVALLDPASGKQVALRSLRGEPAGVAISPDGKSAYVSLPPLDQVAVLSLPDLEVRERIGVGRRPRALALTPDGATLLAANLQGGDVSVVDTGSLQETRRIEVTGRNLRGIAVTADGKRAFVTGQIPGNTRVTRDPLDMWINTLFVLDLRPEAKAGSAEGWLDFAAASAPDPDGVTVLGPELVALTLAGSDETVLVRTPGPHLRSYDPQITARRVVGARPRGIALSPDRKQLWVANELESTVALLDAATLKLIRKIPLGAPEREDPRLEGRYLFGSAKLARGGQFSCASCHPNVSTDGLSWQFVHVPDRVPNRNSRALRGGVPETSPFRWSGHEKEIEDFFQDEVVGLLGGDPQPAPALHALRRMLEGAELPANPYRADDDSLTPQAQRGKAIFEGKGGCSGCHSGPMHGGTGTRAWIGTTEADRDLDVPHLRGAFDSAPYLHDGRAETLESIFQRHNGEKKHGRAHELSPAELADVLRYVREL